MAILDADLGGTLREADHGALVEIPWKATSVALRVTTVVPTTSSEWKCPVLDSDVTSAYVGENEPIDLSDPSLDSCSVTPRALATLTRVSDEALVDGTPAAISIISDSIVRSLSFATDASWVAASTPKGSPGLKSLIGNGAQSVPVVGSISDLDPFVSAIGLLEAHGAKATAFVADSTTWTALALLRQFDGTDLTSNVPLLGADPTAPQGRSVQGVPCFSLRSGCLEPGTVIALDGSRVFTVIRSGVQLDTSKDLYFDSRATAVRASTRIAFAFPDPASVVFIGSGGS